MRRIPANTFDREWVILCEGEADKRFLDRLIQFHDITPVKFSVHFPSRGDDPTGGRGKFGRWLAAAHETSQSFQDNVGAVLVISDNDDNRAASFGEVAAGLTAGGFPVPQQERVVARQRDYPDIVVLMIPIGENGNLETLCVRAAYSKWDLEGCLDTYVAGTPAAQWRLGKQSKMRMQALLAATCETQPDISLAYVWQQREEFHLPLGDPAFAGIVEFLTDFENLLNQ